MFSYRHYLNLLISVLCVFACATKRVSLDDLYGQAREAYSRKEYEQARQYYKQFVMGNPDKRMQDVAMYYWAYSARQTGRLKEAEEVYNKLISQYENGFWVELGRKDLLKMEHKEE